MKNKQQISIKLGGKPFNLFIRLIKGRLARGDALGDDVLAYLNGRTVAHADGTAEDETAEDGD